MTRILLAIALVLGMSSSVVMAAQDAEEVCATLWEMEQRIYEGRARGDDSYYLSIASKAYMGWPPQFPGPATYETLAGIQPGSTRPSGEQIDKTLRGCTVDDDVALLFYSTHRTRAAGGVPVDQRFETIHVFVRRADQWLLIGAMARPQPDRPPAS
jgi:hypothetical protein